MDQNFQKPFAKELNILLISEYVFRVASKMRFVHFINIQKMSFDLSILQNGLGYINATVTQLLLRALNFRAENSKVLQ